MPLNYKALDLKYLLACFHFIDFFFLISSYTVLVWFRTWEIPIDLHKIQYVQHAPYLFKGKSHNVK